MGRGKRGFATMMILSFDTFDFIRASFYFLILLHLRWWDGSVKHVIINSNFYESYKSKVQKIITTIEKRWETIN